MLTATFDEFSYALGPRERRSFFDYFSLAVAELGNPFASDCSENDSSAADAAPREPRVRKARDVDVQQQGKRKRGSYGPSKRRYRTAK